MKNSIHLSGIHHHNLKNIDIDIPLNKLTVITGISGSGKSTLAFDVLYAEGQRRYIETFSPYARQFFDRMDKPKVDHIDHILPSIAIEQRNTVKTSRSTVGTMTEICDYMKILWPHISSAYCPKCGKKIESISAHDIWNNFCDKYQEINTCLIVFCVEITSGISIKKAIKYIHGQGYRRCVSNGQVTALENIPENYQEKNLYIIQDRITIAPKYKKRFIDSCEQAYKYGHDTLYILDEKQLDINSAIIFSNKQECSKCGIKLPRPIPGLFSYNHPLGACPTCHGFGRTIGIDLDLVIPDKTKTLREGAIRPWQTGFSIECQEDMIRLGAIRKIPLDIPFNKLTAAQKRWVIDGEPDYGKDKEHSWQTSWYGINGYFRWLESNTYKMHIRVFLSRYRAYKLCTTCNGTRFVPETLYYKSPYKTAENCKLITLADFYNLELKDALIFIQNILTEKLDLPVQFALKEILNRLVFLNKIGLGYLTLNRQTRQLSGGEVERVSLASCLGNHLVSTLYILDEPSVGLHPRDTERLLEIIKKLRNAGNTIVVVEHEKAIIQSADHIIDLGPKAGAEGGKIIYQGAYQKFIATDKTRSNSRTAGYITDRLKINTHPPISGPNKFLKIKGATGNNIHNLDIDIPLQKLVCITGVSGSGKTTLLKKIIFPATERILASNNHSLYNFHINDENPVSVSSVKIPNKLLKKILLIDQSPIGKTPRSNPAIYVDAYDDLRKFFLSKLKESSLQTLSEIQLGNLSYNSALGQCPRCKGLGFEEIEMQFLSNVYTRCPVCKGTRFNSKTLELYIKVRKSIDSKDEITINIADLLNLSIDEVISILECYPNSRYAEKALQKLQIINKTGLGYIILGQPLNTLSGGECQRLKLASHIAEAQNDNLSGTNLFLFDEPSTGLHFDDIQILLDLFHSIVRSGHSIIVIEHNLDIIKSSDWIIDMGPDGGYNGGKVLVQGTLEQIKSCKTSYTGQFLRNIS